MKKYPPLIGTSTRPIAPPARNRPRILIDGREIPGIVSVDAQRCLAIAHQLDESGQPITGPDGLPVKIRRAGKIEFPDGTP